ncbi:MAG: hypothetical protein M9899_09995 [Bdellovibrionaceae bacterium]|nr:hypothetical protein [Pseudobdellovibrionaceae bacterium]
MLKNVLALIVTLGFSASAFAGIEIQINGSGLGTSGGFEMWDNGATDGTDWSLSGEAYWGLSDNLQVGGMLALADGDSMADMAMSLGVAARYNLDSELRNSIFVGGGVIYTDFGPGDSIGVMVQAGKRFAISDTLTWTPNLTVVLNVAGDIDEGHVIALNLLSFSGFLD